MGEVTAGWGLFGLVGVIQICKKEHPVVQVACVAVRKWTLDVEVVRNCGPSKGSQQHRLKKNLRWANQEGRGDSEAENITSA